MSRLKTNGRRLGLALDVPGSTAPACTVLKTIYRGGLLRLAKGEVYSELKLPTKSDSAKARSSWRFACGVEGGGRRGKWHKTRLDVCTWASGDGLTAWSLTN